MLRLSDQIPGDELGGGRAVGDDEAVGRACEHVDADTAEKDAFGLGHELVAGSDQDVRFRQAEETAWPSRPRPERRPWPECDGAPHRSAV